MSKPNYIEVSYGVTRQTSIKFESLRLEYKVGMALDEGEDAAIKLDEVRKTLRNKVNQAVNEEIDWELNHP